MTETLLEQLARESAERERQRSQTDAGKSSLNVIPPGRPYFVAHIPDPLEFGDMRKQFYDIMRTLTYKEAMAWCRGFGYSYSTYLMRRYQHREPKMEEVIITIGWYDDGKPVERKTRDYAANFDRYINYISTLKQTNSQENSASGSSTNLGAEYPL